MDGLAGKEVRAAEKRLTSLLASKWNRPYSEMACFVKTRTGVAIHRAINFYASPWLLVLDLEAQGPRRRSRRPCHRHLSEVVGGLGTPKAA